MAKSWTSVLTLAECRAGIDTPRRPTHGPVDAHPDLAGRDEDDRQPRQTVPVTARANIAPRTTTLSASGSRKAPERVVPWRRASHPSNPSVTATSDPDDDGRPRRAPCVTIRPTKTGVARGEPP